MSTLLPTSGDWDHGVFRLPIRVYYEDTDLGGMMYHGRYVSFFERVRTESIRGTCLDVDRLLSRDAADGGPLLYVVRTINITYHRQARVGDVLLGHSMVNSLRAASIEAKQWLMRGDDLVAEALVTVAIVNEVGRPSRWPADGKALWADWEQQARSAAMGPGRQDRGL